MIQQTQTKQIPKEWKETPLNEVLDYEQPNRYIIKSKIKENGKTPVLTANKSFIKGYVDESDNIYSKIPTIIFDDFTADNKFVNFPFKVKSSAMKILNLKEDAEFDLRFVFYQMQIQKVNTTTHKRYYLSKYQNLKFFFPSLQEQTLIVQEIEKQFTRLDASVKSLKSVKKKLEVYRKAVLKKAFEKKKGWEEKTLKEVCEELFAGGDLPKGNWSKERTEEFQIPIYANGIKNKGLYGYTNIIRTDKYCVTVSARGTIGHTEIREEPFYPIVRLIVAIPKKELDYRYLKYLLDFINVKGNGISIPQLTIPKIKLEKVYFPKTKEEQIILVQEIESKFSVIDKIEQVVNESLEKSEKLRKSILKSAFEGKLVNIEGVGE
jgi:restriction endonuclease S subunit